MFFILQFQDAVLRRKGNEDSRTPHFLYIDEFPEYITKDMDVMFTLFRKYRCGVTVAIQNLSQLDKTGQGYYRQTVLANTKTQIVFGDTVKEDSEYWNKAFGMEKKVDTSESYTIKEDKGFVSTGKKIEIKDKERIKVHKLAELGFGSMFYKTKTANGKTVFGEGKTSFLASKYKEQQNTLMFNFEKYMMTKPDSPTITMNDSDSSSNDDKLFGVNTTNRLKDEIKKQAESSNVNTSNADFIKVGNINDKSDVEIVFEDTSVTLDKQGNGGAITEHYESPIIKRNKK